MELVRPSPEEPLCFPQTIEALFVRGLAGRLDKTAKDGLRAIGLDLDKPLRPAYPASVLVQGTELVARHCYPGKPIREAYFLLGQRAVFGMEETFVGRTQVAFAKVVGPLRSLMMLPRHIAGGSNYAVGSVTQVSPTCIVNDILGYKLPYAEFQEGNLSAVVTICNGKDPKTETLSFDPANEALSVRVSWK